MHPHCATPAGFPHPHAPADPGSSRTPALAGPQHSAPPVHAWSAGWLLWRSLGGLPVPPCVFLCQYTNDCCMSLLGQIAQAAAKVCFWLTQHSHSEVFPITFYSCQCTDAARVNNKAPDTTTKSCHVLIGNVRAQILQQYCAFTKGQVYTLLQQFWWSSYFGKSCTHHA